MNVKKLFALLLFWSLAAFSATPNYLTEDGYKILLGPLPPSQVVEWDDGIQKDLKGWGFDGLGLQNGGTLERVFLDGAYAIKHQAWLNNGTGRAQLGITSSENKRFKTQAQSSAGIWAAHEIKIPEIISAGTASDTAPWLNLWDWHSIDADGNNRWHTSPGLMLAQDGSMRFRFEWGGPANAINHPSAYSTIPLPVGRWFDLEMHYVWSTVPTTISVWIDGKLALEQAGVITRAASHANTETYIKLYGNSNGGLSWHPDPVILYTRNLRFAGERIWR
jgi:hypothetical protein